MGENVRRICARDQVQQLVTSMPAPSMRQSGRSFRDDVVRSRQRAGIPVPGRRRTNQRPNHFIWRLLRRPGGVAGCHHAAIGERLLPQVSYDGRPDFASNPSGSAPSYADALKTTWPVSPTANCAFEPGRPRLARRRDAVCALSLGRCTLAAGSLHDDRGRLFVRSRSIGVELPQHQHRLQPRHGGELPVHEHRAAPISGLGHRVERSETAREQSPRSAREMAWRQSVIKN